MNLEHSSPPSPGLGPCSSRCATQPCDLGACQVGRLAGATLDLLSRKAPSTWIPRGFFFLISVITDLQYDFMFVSGLQCGD